MDARQFAFLARQPSAALVSRERFWGMPKRGIALILANAMFWQPLLVQAEAIAISGPGTGIDQAANGVPIVNIAAPNASGLSHNQFQDYNVGANGLILNNATARTQATELGGIILGNPNLRGQAAATILNEVTGSNRSQLNGYTEVAGQAARVIVANPHGITCNGCGFINTPRVTLSTGKPIIDNGRLDRFAVDGGDIAIEGAGLDASKIDQFDLITRSARINADLYAKKLNVITGRNDVGADNLSVIARAEDGSAKPHLAIDSSALGGMHVGAIRLVGTEHGVGVKLDGNLAASAGDIQIDANGKLTLAKVSASTAIDVKAASLDARGPVYAGTQLHVQTAAELVNRQSLVARDKVVLTAKGQLTNQGVIEAGVNADNSRNASGDVTLDSQALSNSGSIVASRTLQVQAGPLLDNQAGVLQANAVHLRAARLVNQGPAARIRGETSLVLNTPAVINLQGLIRFGDGQAADVSLDSLDNRQGRIEVADGSFKLVARELNNANGTIIADSLDIMADQIGNQAGLIAAGKGQARLQAAEKLENANGKVQAKTQLTLTGKALLNQGGTLRGKRVDIQADTVDNRNQGQINAGADGLLITGSTVQNQNGFMLANGGHAELELGAGTLENQGGTLQGDSLTVHAGDVQNSALDGKAGLISSVVGELKLTIARLTNQAGKIFGKTRITFDGSTLDNRAGGELSGNDLVLAAGTRVLNQGGLIEAGNKLVLTGGSLDNSAGGQVRALAGDLSRIELLGDLNNQGGKIDIGSRAFNLKARQLNNIAGRAQHAGQGLFSLNLASLAGSQGSLIGLGSGNWTVGSVNRVGRWQLNGALTYTSSQALALGVGERIASATGLNVNAASLSNAGELLSDGNLAVTLGGDLVNSGLISAQQQLTVNANNLSQNNGRLASAGDTQLTLRGNLDNLGRLVANRNLTASALRIDNRGTLGALGQVSLSAANGINNAADTLLFSGGAMALRGNSLSNDYGDIYSRGDLSFAALDGGQAASFSNLSGTLESEGNMDLKAMSLENAKADFQIRKGLGGATLSWVCGQHCGGHDSFKRGLITITRVFDEQVLADSPSSRLVAGGNLSIQAGRVENRYSLLAANGNLDISATRLLNQGAASRSGTHIVEIGTPGRIPTADWDQMEYVDVPAFNAAVAAGQFDEARFEELVARSEGPLFSLMSDVTTWNENGNTVYAATLQAGGRVNLNVAETLQNGTLHDNTYAQLTGTLGNDQTGAKVGGLNITLNKQSSGTTAQAPKDVQRIERVDADGAIQVSFVPVDFSGVPFAAIDPTALSSFRLPRGEYGLFVRNPSPQGRYLIETNPSFTQLPNFMSSDYLLGKLNFNSDAAWRRLGNGHYETRLIRDAVLARTGQRFLAAGLTSDDEQYRYLMDNALASKRALNLSVGVSLSAEQVAALTHDIVWMEARVVEGQKVLAPVLYLAQAESRNVRGGSLIQGRDLNLIAGGDLTTVGTLRASHDLSAIAGGSLFQGGLSEANERLTLLAQDTIRNAMAGEIRANQVSLTALKGDIINDRSAIQVSQGAGMRTLVDAGGRISAGDQLRMSAGRDLKHLSQISSAGDASLTAGRDLNLLAVTDASETHTSENGGHRYSITTEVKNLGSSVTSGGNLSLEAGRDLNLVASRATAEGDLNASAARDITLASAGDEHNVETRSKDGKKRLHEEDNHTRQQAAQFSAGGSVLSIAGRDTTLIASHISAGDEAYIYTGNHLNLLAEQNSDYTLYDLQKNGGWGSKQTQRDEVTQLTHVGSEIKSGGDLTLVSGGDQRYQVAKLESGQDLTMESGGSITFEGVKDLRQESHEKSKGDLAWNSAKGIGSTDETLRQTEMFAQGQLAIRAAGKVTIDVKEINQQTVSQAIDAMVEAEPQLAWIKQAEANGQVDWRLVKEVHDSWKYENSGLGAAPALIIAIVASMVIGPLSGALVSNFVVGTINGGGDIGAGFKAATSSDAIKGYATQWATGYALNGLDSYVSGWQTNGALILNGNGINNPGFSSSLLDWNTVSQNVLRSGAHVLVSGGINTAINGGSLKDNLGTALVSEGLDLAAAFGNKQVGDLAEYLKVDPGTASKILMHALLGGALSAAKGGDFTTGALAGAATEGLTQATTDALGKYLDARFATDDQFKVGAAQIIGILAGSLGGGDPATGSWIAGNAERYNRQLHSDEKALARKLAEESGGKYSIEEIAAQLRLSSIKGTNITPATDMVVKSEGIYDHDGNWISLGDNNFVQNLNDADKEIIAYIKQSTDAYTWTLEAETGFSSLTQPDWSKYAQNGTGNRDRLTGYPLDENGGYRVPVAIEGVFYSPRFLSCGNAECIATGANIDFGDANTLRWIKAADTKMIEDLGTALSAGAIVTTGGVSAGMSSGSTIASFLSGYLKSDLAKVSTTAILSDGFERYAIARGMSAGDALKVSNALGVSGAWNKLFDSSKELLKAD
ncbi:DUF637 domain-containing protein [Pseudomonas sp. LS1212]|uniref:two-partner secretion domain-containing protein n=1 Tax=Pseudomonas sp. LS1212 TaxID=2972478 RepID=UPI00215B9B86|nr:DUF637 domain-containing protein [Pseudomonas sp. LS1212]UVJ44672.1 DUF637 domain-containing protein [Pseudomonas sp. LS1212]